MNKKLIAAAVSAAVVAPVASHADAVLYGRINNAIDINDTDGSEDADSTTHLRNVVSRIGVRANAETNSGLGVHGHYEFLTVSDREEDDDGSGIDDTRIATVGVSGGFGRFDVGQQWSAYFNTFGTLVSPTYSLGYYLYSSIGGGVFRASNTIKYSNTFGPVTAQLDVRLNEDGAETADQAEALRGDGIGLGLSFAVSDNITIAAAFDSEDGAAAASPDDLEPGAANTAVGDGILATYNGDDFNDGREAGDTDRIGLAVKANFGGFWAALGWQNYETADRDPLMSTTDFAIDLNDDGDATDTDEAAAARVLDDGAGADIDTMFLWGGGKFSDQTSWMVGYAVADDGRDGGNLQLEEVKTPADRDTAAATAYNVTVAEETDDSSQVTVGIYHNLGGGMRIYYEGVSLDSENENYDGIQHLFGMRVDF